jgi:5-dehydro-2-deoxygluconokinase
MTLEASVPPFDLLSIGRIGVDLYPQQVGLQLEDVSSFGKYLGGSPSNVAVAAAKHELKSAVITKVGKDPFGDYLVRELGRLGVDTSYVGVSDELLTPVVFCEIFPPDNFPLYFYRKPSAPDMEIRADSLDLDTISSAKVFWFTVTGLSEEPSRGAHFAALAERSRKRHTIIDLDYRETFWDSPLAASEQIEMALAHVDIAIGNREECLVAIGESDPDRAADALLDRGVELAVVKMGPRGVLAKSREERVAVSPHKVSVVNGLGAGDSFGGAFVFGLSQGWDLRRILEFANVAGALVASRIECSTAMPTTQEVLDELAERNSWG